MSTRAGRAARRAAKSLAERANDDVVKTEHADENIAPATSEPSTHGSSKDLTKDFQAKTVLHEQDQNQPNSNQKPTPKTSPISTDADQIEPLKRKLSRPIKVVKAEETDFSAVEQENTSKDESEEDEEDEDDAEDEVEDPDDGEFSLRPKKQRIEQPRKVATLKITKDMSDYERMRLENIRKNEEMLLALELPTMSMKLQADVMEGRSVQASETSNPKKFAPMAGKSRKPKAPSGTVTPVISARTSNRLRGLKPAEEDENPEASMPTISKSVTAEAVDEDDDANIDRSKLMAADLYFDEETRNKAIRVDGHYKGWINKNVMERYGFEKSASEAWEANGGGTFSFKDPMGSGGGRSKKFNAKLFSKAMFKKNPNAYFYRHNEPGEDQWTGDWTAEERDLFLEVAREFGCGDKWGLFASHIPHRVGYQCSNYYRQVILPEGLVFDPNYEFTSNGRPIYCGKYNQRR